MANPVCALNCAALLLPVKFSNCAPEVNLSEIKMIYIGKANTPAFTDVTDQTEWLTRLSETGGTDSALRPLTVIGDKPAPTSTPRPISNGRVYTPSKTHTLNLTIDETGQLNYEFLRGTECGGQYKIWYETSGGYMYGGNEGILVSLNLDDILARGVDEIEVFNGVATWNNRFSPERTVSPFSTGPAPITYDTILTFAAAVTDTDQGVTGEIAAINANAKFEFKAISPRPGTPASMTINIAGSEYMTVDFTTDYLGQPFRVTNNTAQVFTGTFTNGTVNL